MKTLHTIWRESLAVFLMAGALCQAQSSEKSVLLTSAADPSTALRFYWFGDMWTHWRAPMDLYVVEVGDKRLHTVLVNAPLHQVGIEAFVTASEMNKLIQKLALSDFSWNASKKVERFGSPWKQSLTDGFEITVVSSIGTVKGHIRLARMCDELSQFDALMPTERIRWQFRTLRWDDGCSIPGYHNEVVPTD